MKIYIIILFMCFSFQGFSDYLLVLKNNSVIELKSEPVYTGKTLTAERTDGTRILLRKNLVDFEKTEEANRERTQTDKKTPIIEKKDVNKEKETRQKTSNDSGSVLVITDKTIGRTQKDIEKQKKEKSTMGYLSRKSNKVGDDLGPMGNSGPLDSKGRGKDYWYNAFKILQQRILKAQKEKDELESKLNLLSTYKLNAVETQNILNINEEIEKINTKIQDKNAELQRLKAEKENLKNEAKKSRALPGWYREFVD